MPLSALQLDEKYLIALRACPLSVRDATVQLIKFYANFTRVKTLDEAYAELGNEFLRLTEQPRPKKSAPVHRAEEAPNLPQPAGQAIVDSAVRNALR